MLTEQSVDSQLLIRLYISILKMNMNIHIIKKKILNLINALMNIRHKTYCALNRISFLKHYALKHIVNRLNDGTYYVNINFNVCLHKNNLFHIYMWRGGAILRCKPKLLIVRKSDYATLGVNPRENIQTTQELSNKARRFGSLIELGKRRG